MASKNARCWARGPALALVVCVPFAIGALRQRSHQHGGPELLSEVLTIVEQRGVDSLGQDSIYQLAARGLVHDLNDPYASLYSPTELSSFMRNAIGNAYGGLGMTVVTEGRTVAVNSVFAHSPASNGGVEPGDEIIAVNGSPVAGESLDSVTKQLTGPVGTQVTATFARAGVTQPIMVTFTRALVHAQSVPYTLVLENHVGYIPIQRFNETSANEVAAAVDSLRKAGATRYILDLRGDGGGDFDQSLVIGNLFLPKGSLLATLRQRGRGPQQHRAQRDPLVAQEPVAVLVDGGTASASEIVAGALQDHDRAVVLGTATFGKGLVQSVFNLDHGYALKLTTGKWYTPSGRTIQRERKFVDGRFVEDSAADTAKAKTVQPTTRSDAGRVLAAGGGIAPDVVVKPDSSPTAVRTFLKAIAPKGAAVNAALFDIARNQRGHVTFDFAVTPELRAQFFERIVGAGVTLTRAQFDDAQPWIDRLLTQRILGLELGDAAAFRRSIPQDITMQRALSLLSRSQTQAQLLMLATTGGT